MRRFLKARISQCFLLAAFTFAFSFLPLRLSAASISSSPAGDAPSMSLEGGIQRLKARLLPCTPAPQDRANELYVFEDRAWCSESIHSSGVTTFGLQFLDAQTVPVQRASFKGYDLNKEGLVEPVEYLLESVQLGAGGWVYFSFEIPTFQYENIFFERRGFFVFETLGTLEAASTLWCVAVNMPCETGTHVGSALDTQASAVSAKPPVLPQVANGLKPSSCGRLTSESFPDQHGGQLMALLALCLGLIFLRRSKQRTEH